MTGFNVTMTTVGRRGVGGLMAVLALLATAQPNHTQRDLEVRVACGWC